jgi:hypothetical protein
VSPVRLCPLPSPLYTVLMGYKESPVPEARARFTPMVRSLFDDFFAAHAACLAAGGPVGQVPGLSGDVRARFGGCWCDDVLRRGPGRLGHMRPARDGFAVPPERRAEVQGRHVLVLDDTYVSGARAQSAAGALRLAGAVSVQIVAAGRVLRPDLVPGHADFLRRHAAASTPEPACRGCVQTGAPSG